VCIANHLITVRSQSVPMTGTRRSPKAARHASSDDTPSDAEFLPHLRSLRGVSASIRRRISARASGCYRVPFFIAATLPITTFSMSPRLTHSHPRNCEYAAYNRSALRRSFGARSFRSGESESSESIERTAVPGGLDGSRHGLGLVCITSAEVCRHGASRLSAVLAPHKSPRASQSNRHRSRRLQSA
jgi:hypothetical protein